MHLQLVAWVAWVGSSHGRLRQARVTLRVVETTEPVAGRLDRRLAVRPAGEAGVGALDHLGIGRSPMTRAVLLGIGIC